MSVAAARPVDLIGERDVDGTSRRTLTPSSGRRAGHPDGTTLVGPASRLGEAPAGTDGLTRPALPVLPALASLLPGGKLRRGTVATVQGSGALLLALLAAASAGGSWCAEVGSPLVGSAAAAELGVALDRFVRVQEPGPRWPEVVASLLDGFDVVVVHPPCRRTARDDQAVRRLTARTRERGAVLVATAPWEGSALGLTVTAARWHGLGRGHGHLAAREVVVAAVGRGSAVRPRHARIWLPAADGRVVAAGTAGVSPARGDPDTLAPAEHGGRIVAADTAGVPSATGDPDIPALAGRLLLTSRSDVTRVAG